VAAMLLLTLRGTPTLYYGDEIGMEDVEIPASLAQDPWENNVPGLGLGRDPERTPMQWDAGPHAGFTTGRPWLPLSADASTVNVAVQREDPTSMLSLHRRLLALRRDHPALAVGRYELAEVAGDVLAYVRTAGEDRCLVCLNVGASPARLSISPANPQGVIALSTLMDRSGETAGAVLDLRPHEGIVIASA